MVEAVSGSMASAKAVPPSGPMDVQLSVCALTAAGAIRHARVRPNNVADTCRVFIRVFRDGRVVGSERVPMRGERRGKGLG
jgi:hypothetical protein